MHIISVFSWLALANAEMREQSQICTCIMTFSVKSECGFHRFVKCATHVNLSYSKEGCNIFMFFREWQKSILTINHVLKSCCILLIIYILMICTYTTDNPAMIASKVWTLWLRAPLVPSLELALPFHRIRWTESWRPLERWGEIREGNGGLNGNNIYNHIYIIIYIYIYIYKWSI